ncbi:hypothetical protein M9H77_21892 [Catharanthus roseus]|uniref:Uncharacterized protein n=1 Tax=Catharanthus roseus TaxID=4058 RepID=A0ACC0APS0_CATRO|nr:hypothetical protein M9H77_21892 [Catharanthus roseus]
MSDKCGNCDSADNTQCTKKENTFDIIQTENGYTESIVMEEGAENDGKCKCGTSCSCVNCTCGSH